ncbi:MAG: glycerol-3-phosphate dehydrogenase/oxidase [Gallionella sp.]|nr:glycerol-3-phosphate dehydrogenase/oxidase [Gallionella sp.]
MKRDFSLLTGRQFDLLVCGGGIYGAWTAYDAALRGLSVAIVEQGDWANATSSASSKLIHGGLRYLETYDFKLVRKALAERQMLLDMAPHRVWPLRFGVPVYKDSRIGTLKLKAGLTLYDLLAGRPGSDTAHHRFDSKDFAGRFPALDDEGLKGGFTYGDAQTDDARLVLELIAGAMAAGAVCVNYCRLTELKEAKGLVYGAMVRDQLTDTDALIRAGQIVNTTGQWIAASDTGRNWCRLTKGIHLVMPAVLRDEALLLTARSDGRVFFMIPWYGMTLLGTTDTDYKGGLDHVSAEPEDIAYLLSEANHYLKTAWAEKDVLGSYAGVRVMKRSDKASPSSVSRDWELKSSVNGVHHSIGGKLTSAREDASQIVDAVCAAIGATTPCATKNRPFPWVPERDFSEWSAVVHVQATQLGIAPEIAKWLMRRHGKRAGEVLRSVEGDSRQGELIVPTLPFIYADLLFCARNEMAVHMDDLLRRRMPLLILAKLTDDALRCIAETVAPVMGWDEAAINRELKACRGAI